MALLQVTSALNKLLSTFVVEKHIILGLLDTDSESLDHVFEEIQTTRLTLKKHVQAFRKVRSAYNPAQSIFGGLKS